MTKVHIAATVIMINAWMRDRLRTPRVSVSNVVGLVTIRDHRALKVCPAQ
jgi:hypothetical protein